jgi:transposase-like protein
VLTELKQRGVQDVLVCCVDGLKGFPEAIEAVYPKKIYTATDRDHAETELEAFAAKWDHRYPMISASWIDNWERIVPFLLFPPDVRRVIYTTNTIEALNRQIRKTIKTRGHFPHQDAARKLLYLAITTAQTNWRSTYNWSAALAAFRIHFGDRLPDHAI